MGIFSKCQIALDLDTSLGFKKKAAIKSQVIENDGIISYIVTKKVNLLFCTETFPCSQSLVTVFVHWARVEYQWSHRQ